MALRRTRSPGLRSALSAIRWPFSIVPFLLLRSLTSQWPLMQATSQWKRLTVGLVTRIVLREERPMVVTRLSRSL